MKYAAGLLLWLCLIVPAHAQTKGFMAFEWDAPTTNTDSSPLTDLNHYRIYVGTPTSGCTGGPYTVVTSPTPAPNVGDTVQGTVGNLNMGVTYVAQVTAVDSAGSESACSNTASGLPKNTTPPLAPTGLQIHLVY